MQSLKLLTLFFIGAIIGANIICATDSTSQSSTNTQENVASNSRSAQSALETASSNADPSKDVSNQQMSVPAQGTINDRASDSKSSVDGELSTESDDFDKDKRAAISWYKKKRAAFNWYKKRYSDIDPDISSLESNQLQKESSEENHEEKRAAANWYHKRAAMGFFQKRTPFQWEWENLWDKRNAEKMVPVADPDPDNSGEPHGLENLLDEDEIQSFKKRAAVNWYKRAAFNWYKKRSGSTQAGDKEQEEREIEELISQLRKIIGENEGNE